MTFGQWLGRKRLELSARRGQRITQADIALAAGISRQYYGFLESGAYPSRGKLLDGEIVERLAGALEVERDEAFRAAGFGDRLSDEEWEVLRRYRRLDSQRARVVKDLLETMVPNRGVLAGLQSAAGAPAS